MKVVKGTQGEDLSRSVLVLTSASFEFFLLSKIGGRPAARKSGTNAALPPRQPSRSSSIVGRRTISRAGPPDSYCESRYYLRIRVTAGRAADSARSSHPPAGSAKPLLVVLVVTDMADE
jgi:hypothetical protein